MPVTLDGSIDLEFFGSFMPGGKSAEGLPLDNLLLCNPDRFTLFQKAMELDAVLGVKDCLESFRIAGLCVGTARLRIQRANLTVIEVHPHQAMALGYIALAAKRCVEMGAPEEASNVGRRVIIPGAADA